MNNIPYIEINTLFQYFICGVIYGMAFSLGFYSCFKLLKLIFKKIYEYYTNRRTYWKW